MVFVHDVVAGLEIREKGAHLHTTAALFGVAGLPEAEDLGIREDP